MSSPALSSDRAGGAGAVLTGPQQFSQAAARAVVRLHLQGSGEDGSRRVASWLTRPPITVMCVPVSPECPLGQ